MGLLSTIGSASGRAFGLTRVGAAIRDAYFNLTTLLLPGNGTNGAQNNTFIDSSTNNFTITRNGNTTQGTFSPFSQTGWSNAFNGSSTCLRTTALNISTGNWTIEAWVSLNVMPTSDSWPASYSSWMVVVGVGTASLGNGWQFRIGQTQLAFGTNSDTTAVNGSHGMVPGQWYHLAATRSGNVYTLYVNGVSVASATYTANAPGTGAYTWIGAETNEGAYLNGYISNLRIVSGSVVYTSNFTPSTTPLTAITNTSLLTCQSNSFVDNSSNAFAITVNGTPSVQPFSPFAPTAAYSAATNGGSGYFDGTGDYLTVGSNFSLGSGDFSIEGWLYCSSLPTNWRVLSQGTPTTGDFMLIGYSNGGADFTAAASSAIAFPSGSFAVNTWTHFAIVRSGTGTNNLKGYINGVNVVSATSTYNYSSTSNIYVGLNPNNTAQAFNGYVASLRISNNARTITVPTSPYSSDGNTRALLNFTNAGITDATAKNDLETVGNAQISTTQSKFGGSSIYLDGTGDYLVGPSNQWYNFGTGDFTIECWARFGTVNVAKIIVSSNYNSSTGAGGWAFILRGDISSLTLSVNSNVTYNKSWSPSTNTWYHIAVSRSGTNLRFFVDGTQLGTTSTSSDNVTGASTIVVGGNLGGGTNLTLDGYLDDLRITNYARYTANFTAPTAAFPLS